MSEPTKKNKKLLNKLISAKLHINVAISMAEKGENPKGTLPDRR